MSLPQRPPLPKPPPKAGPAGLPPRPGAPGAHSLPSHAPAGLPPARPVVAAPAMPAAAPAAPAMPAQAMPVRAPMPQQLQPAPIAPAAPAMPALAAMAPGVPAAPRAPVAMANTAGLPAAMVGMVEAIRIYEELLIEENAALRASDSKTVEKLLDRKMGATRLYQDRLRTVLGDAEITRSLSTDQRAQIVSMVRSLEDLAKENTVLLKANMGAIEQLFEVINTAARKMRKREVAYSQAGIIRDYHTAATTSLAYNHTV